MQIMPNGRDCFFTSKEADAIWEAHLKGVRLLHPPVAVGRGHTSGKTVELKFGSEESRRPELINV